jgi:PhnB protein
MDLNPYLLFDGRCAAAFKFYAKTLGGKIVAMQTHGDSPMKDQVAPDWQDKILHAKLVVGDKTLMGSDAPPANYERPKGIQVSISLTDATEAERIFKELADSGKVTLPFQKTFWSPGFGMTVDRFGIPWIVNCEPGA